MRNIITIAKRELRGYFSSPVAFVFIVIFLMLSGFFTFMVAGFFERGEANLQAFFSWHPWLYLFLATASVRTGVVSPPAAAPWPPGSAWSGGGRPGVARSPPSAARRGGWPPPAGCAAGSDARRRSR